VLRTLVRSWAKGCARSSRGRAAADLTPHESSTLVTRIERLHVPGGTIHSFPAQGFPQ